MFDRPARQERLVYDGEVANRQPGRIPLCGTGDR